MLWVINLYSSMRWVRIFMYLQKCVESNQLRNPIISYLYPMYTFASCQRWQSYCYKIKISTMSRSSHQAQITMRRFMNFEDLPGSVLVELICRISCCGLISQCKCVSTCWCIFILLIAFDVNQGIISIANYTCLNKHFQRNYFPMREISLTMLLTLMFRQFMSSNGLRDEPTTVCTYNDLVLCRLGLGYY